MNWNFQQSIFIVGITLLMVVIYNWVQNQSSQCATDCSVTWNSCKAGCKPAPVAEKFHSKRITEQQLHERFADYSPPDSQTEDYDPAGDSLDQSVYDSHAQFVDESYVSTQGPNSANVERDDTNEVVKRWGLRRVDYSTATSGDDARTVSSEYPEQMPTGESSFVL